MGESLDEAAARVLAEKAGVEGVFLEQLYTFGNRPTPPHPGSYRSYYALVDAHRLSAMLQGRALTRLRVPWKGESGRPVQALDEEGNARELTFDHGAHPRWSISTKSRHRLWAICTSGS